MALILSTVAPTEGCWDLGKDRQCGGVEISEDPIALAG